MREYLVEAIMAYDERFEILDYYGQKIKRDYKFGFLRVLTSMTNSSKHKNFVYIHEVNISD